MSSRLLPRKSQSAQLGRAAIGPRFRLVRTFDLAPPSGRVALGGRFPGLKPWAEFCSPFGAQNKGLSPKIVAYSFDICLLDFWLVNHYKLSIEISLFRFLTTTFLPAKNRAPTR
jgi:hypothetical protein